MNKALSTVTKSSPFRVTSAKDFAQHAKLCDRLLAHYSSQFLDRRTYWAARDRAVYQKDILCLIVDSFDKSKISLPKYPYHRVPKRSVYEFYHRNLSCEWLQLFLFVTSHRGIWDMMFIWNTFEFWSFQFIESRSIVDFDSRDCSRTRLFHVLDSTRRYVCR